MTFWLLLFLLINTHRRLLVLQAFSKNKCLIWSFFFKVFISLDLLWSFFFLRRSSVAFIQDLLPPLWFLLASITSSLIYQILHFIEGESELHISSECSLAANDNLWACPGASPRHPTHWHSACTAQSFHIAPLCLKNSLSIIPKLDFSLHLSALNTEFYIPVHSAISPNLPLLPAEAFGVSSTFQIRSTSTLWQRTWILRSRVVMP